MTGLYLHIPFCRRKCPYCDFFSIAATDTALQEYPDLLQRQLMIAVTEGWQGPVDTIYFGGGTPSLLKPSAISQLLSAIDRQLGITADAEITLEANPGTVDLEILHGYQRAGVNRLSLGLQTLSPRQLQHLGRLHSREDGQEAVAQARQAGFDNLSLDLIFALPGQTSTELQQEIDAYLSLAPEHLSCYGLTAEPDTPFGNQAQAGSLELPDEDRYAEMFLMLDERLAQHGYQHYEIANYAREGFACRHNLGYWERRPYLGLGAGAHSFVDSGWGQRSAVPNDLSVYKTALYAGRNPAETIEAFSREGALSEHLYLGLRTRSGVSEATLRDRFDITLSEAYPQAVEQLTKWLTFQNGNWSFTPAGWLLYDRLIQAFL